MPYEDHLQKQIDRFAQALGALLSRIAGGNDQQQQESPSFSETLKTQTGLGVSDIIHLDMSDLEQWFTRTPFNHENRHATIKLLHAQYKAHPEPRLKTTILQLISLADREAGSISLERLEIRNSLEA